MTDIRHEHPSEKLLQAFLDGAVPSRERRRIEAHVTSCTRCTEELATWSVLFEDLDALRALTPGGSFTDRVMAGVRVPAEVPWAVRVKQRLGSLLPQPRTEHLPGGILQDLVDGALTKRASVVARRHLDGCEACTAELRSWTGVMDRLSELERLAPAESFADDVMAGLTVRAATQAAVVRTPRMVRQRAWGRVLEGAKRFVPRTRRAWAAISGVAVTPAVTFGLVLWAVFSHPTATPQALVSFGLWQLGDLAVAAWGGLLSGGLQVARMTGLDGLIEAMIGAPLMAAGGFALYAVAFVFALRVLYKNLIDSRTPRHRYASASAS